MEGNTVNGANADDGIYLYAPDCTPFVVANNTSTNNLNHGLNLYLGGATISGNTGSYNGYSYSYGGFHIEGDGNAISQNFANNNAEDGFEVLGCTNNVVGNQAKSNLDDGIEIVSLGCGIGNTLERNLAQYNQGEGIALGSDPASVRYNTSRNNRKPKAGASGDCTSDAPGPGQILVGNVCSDGSNVLNTNEIE